jgi:hypothetical protein
VHTPVHTRLRRAIADVSQTAVWRCYGFQLNARCAPLVSADQPEEADRDDRDRDACSDRQAECRRDEQERDHHGESDPPPARADTAEASGAIGVRGGDTKQHEAQGKGEAEGEHELDACREDGECRGAAEERAVPGTSEERDGRDDERCRRDRGDADCREERVLAGHAPIEQVEERDPDED